MKTFGSRTPVVVIRDEFTLWVERDGQMEEHVFDVLPRVSAQDVIMVTQAEKNPEQGIDTVLRILRKSIADDDGVKASWKLEELPPAPVTDQQARKMMDRMPGVPRVPAPATGMLQYEADRRPARTAPVEEVAHAPSFRGPDGRIYALDDQDAVDRFTSIENGSSRRRWDHLMGADEDADVQFADLMDLLRWVIGLATDRPTESSAS